MTSNLFKLFNISHGWIFSACAHVGLLSILFFVSSTPSTQEQQTLALVFLSETEAVLSKTDENTEAIENINENTPLDHYSADTQAKQHIVTETFNQSKKTLRPQDYLNHDLEPRTQSDVADGHNVPNHPINNERVQLSSAKIEIENSARPLAKENTLQKLNSEFGKIETSHTLKNMPGPLPLKVFEYNKIREETALTAQADKTQKFSIPVAFEEIKKIRQLKTPKTLPTRKPSKKETELTQIPSTVQKTEQLTLTKFGFNVANPTAVVDLRNNEQHTIEKASRLQPSNPENSYPIAIRKYLAKTPGIENKETTNLFEYSVSNNKTLNKDIKDNKVTGKTLYDSKNEFAAVQQRITIKEEKNKDLDFDIAALPTTVQTEKQPKLGQEGFKSIVKPLPARNNVGGKKQIPSQPLAHAGSHSNGAKQEPQTKILRTWGHQIRQKLVELLSNERKKGSVKVELTLLRNGKLKEVTVADSGNNIRFARHISTIIKGNKEKFPPAPAAIQDDYVTFPIRLTLND
jgi:hypothetical protein